MMTPTAVRSTGISAIVLSLFLACSVVAAKTITEVDYSVERNLYKLAQFALSQNNMDDYGALKAQLRDYPLYPYLVYSELNKRLSKALDSELEDFLSDYADVPASHRLRGLWLRKLAKQGRWKKFLAVYDGRKDTDLQCYNIRARIRAGQQDEVLSEAESIWLSGRSQPNACDRVFEWMESTDKLTPELVWERIYLVMESNNSGLVRYLTRKLNEKDRSLMSLWEQVHDNPGKALSASSLEEDSRLNRAIVRYGVRRLARRDLDSAYTVWNRIRMRYGYGTDLHDVLDRELALSAAFRDHPLAGSWLSALHKDVHNEDTRRWLAHVALRDSDWQGLNSAIELMETDERERNKWRYWRARALIELGRREQALPLLEGLKEERSFYGFLAADRLSVPYSMNHTPLQVGAENIQEIAATPGAIRAHELYHAGQMWEARSEWNSLIANMGAAQLQTAAQLAGQWGWHDNAISTVAMSRSYDDLELRFPLSHRDKVHQVARFHSLDPEWIYGVIRRESAFAAHARSGAGAVGLMQLLPATARQVARNNKLPVPRQSDLVNADRNIELGSGYLRFLMERYANHQVLATAAYNAGPGRVTRWLPDKTLSADQWIDTIPFRETRHYVRAVMEYATVYEWKLERKVTRLSERLRPVGKSASS